MTKVKFQQFRVFLDRYYWQTAILIARNGLARQYRNSFLGIFWTLLQPASAALIYALVMPVISRMNGRDYVLYVLVSLPVWNFISGSLIAACSSIIGNGETLKRCTVSSTLFPVADVLRNAYTFAISFGTAYVICFLLGIASPSFSLLLLPLYFIPVLIGIGSIAIALAFIAPYIRDVGELLVNTLMVAFWLTPVIYSASLLSEQGRAWEHWNPFFIIIRPIQILAYEHSVPGAGDNLRLMAFMGVSLLFGFSVFKRCRRNFIYYL